MSKRRITTVFLGLALLAAPFPAAAGPVKKPTVLLVTIDTIRADRLGCYGHDRSTTPVIDRLTSEGLLFRETVAMVPLTTPSHVSIFTGLNPRTHAVLGNAGRLGDSFTTLAERFRDAGYNTAAFVSAVVLDPRCGLDRGFGHYSALPRPGPNEGLQMPRPAGPPGEKGPPARASRMAGRQRRGQETVDQALAWMAGQSDGKPLFVWVHLYDPHQPYDPPQPYRDLFGPERGERNLSALLRPEFDERKHEREFDETEQRVREEREQRHRRSRDTTRVPSIAAGSLSDDERERINELYDGEVVYADYQVGRLLAWLKGRGLYEKSVVTVMGDHGETLGEHRDYYGHHHVLYDASLLIPLIIRLPGTARGKVLPVTATTADLVPTLLGALGMASPTGLDGRDLLGGPLARPVYCETFLGVRPGLTREEMQHRPSPGPLAKSIHQHALRDGRWKMVVSGGAEGAPMLFDLEADPGEQTDVAGAHQALVKSLARHWQRWCETHVLPRRSRDHRSTPAVDDEMRNKLRQLGYAE